MADLKKKTSNKYLKITLGIIFILIGLLTLGNLISILLVIFGAYLVYESLKKKK